MPLIPLFTSALTPPSPAPWGPLLGQEPWYPLANLALGEDEVPLHGNPFAGTVPYTGGPTGPDVPDADDDAEEPVPAQDLSLGVNYANGNLVVQVQVANAQGIPTNIALTYNLQDTTDRGYGAGWMLSNDDRLDASASLITLTTGTGSQRPYAVSSGFTVPPPGVFTLLGSSGSDLAEIRRNGKQRVYKSGRLDHVVDRNGNAWTMSRDGSANLTGIQDPSGRRFTLAWASSHLATVLDPAGRVVTLGYDANTPVRLSSIQRADGSRVTLSYSGTTPQLQSLYDHDGYLTTFTLGTVSGNPAISAVNFPDMAVRSLSYDTTNRQCVVTDPLSVVWTASLDTGHRLSAYAGPSSRITSLVWSANSQVTRLEEPLNRVRSYLYNAWGRMNQYTSPVNAITSLVYAPDGKQLQSSIDPLLYRTTSVYDAGNGDRLAYVDEEANRVTYAYALNGQLKTLARNIDGRSSTLLYDYYGTGETSPKYLPKRRRLSLDAQGSYADTSFAYDAIGNPTQVLDPDRRTLNYEYTPLDWLQAEIDGAGPTYLYDARGNPIATIDPMGNRFSSVYDARSRLLATVDPLLNRSSLVYDLAGQHIASIDPENTRTTHAYAPVRDLTSTRDPLTGTITYMPDLAGRTVQTVDGGGRSNGMAFDPADRVIQQAVYLLPGDSVATPGNPVTWLRDYTPRDEPSAVTDPTGVRVSTTFDGTGRTRAMIRTGQSGQVRTTLGYVSTGAIKTHQDGRGFVTTELYDEAGRRFCTIDALNQRTTYLYTPAGDISAILNARGARVTFSYDELHRQTERIVAPWPGIEQRFTTLFDDAGRVIKEIYPDLSSMVYGYFENGWLKFQGDPMGGRVSLTYNNRGQVRTRTDQEGRVVTRSYDLQGRLVETQDPEGFRSTTVYDFSNNPGVQVDPLLNRVTYVYDGASRLTEEHVSPQSGIEYVTRHFYDGAGRVTMTYFPDGTTNGFVYSTPEGDGYRLEIDELGRVRTISWDAVHNDISTVDPNGNFVYRRTYDALNRILYEQTQRTYDAGMASRSFAYDQVSNRVATIDALGHRRTDLYDLLNRVVTMVRSTGSVGGNLLLTESQDYDSRGNMIYRQDARGNRVNLFYDLNQRPVVTVDPLGGRVTSSYDRSGRRIAVQSPNVGGSVAITSMGYDRRGLLTSLVHPGGDATEQYQYDAAGRRTVQVLPSGKRITYTYDGLGRQTQLTPPDGATVEVQGWDSRSRRVFLADGVGVTGYGYTMDGRLSQVSTPNGILNYSYDPGGRRVAMSYVAGLVQYGYDRDNNLTLVVNPWNERSTYSWDLAERLGQVNLANGSVVSQLYDNADRLLYRGDPDRSGGTGYLYTLDANGNRTGIAENDGSTTANSYDPKNRLTSESRTGAGGSPSYGCTYIFDLNDNLVTRDLPTGGSVTFVLDSKGRITGDDQGTTYNWDIDGRLLSRTGGIGTASFTYDWSGRATGMTVGSGADPLTLTYYYDGDGRLQWLYRKGYRSRFLLDGRNVLRECIALPPVTATFSPTEVHTVTLRPRDLPRLALSAGQFKPTITRQMRIDYTHGLGLLSERVTTLTPVVSISTGYFRWDARSTSGRREDPNGTVIATPTYDAYGLLRSTPTLTSFYGFVGEEGVRQEKLAKNAPYHMRARMYDPLLGRFTSRDPVWDLNLYEYAKGNPWSNVDPDGREAKTGGRRPLLPGAERIPLGDRDDPNNIWRDTLIEHGFLGFTRDQQEEIIKAVREVNALPGDLSGQLYRHDQHAVYEFWRKLYWFQAWTSVPPDPEGRGAHLYNQYINTHVDPRPWTLQDTREVLETLAMVPVIGEGAAGAALLISVYQGDASGALWNLVGLIPGGAYLRAGRKVSGALVRLLATTEHGRVILSALTSGAKISSAAVAKTTRGVSEQLSRAQLKVRAVTGDVEFARVRGVEENPGRQSFAKRKGGGGAPEEGPREPTEKDETYNTRAEARQRAKDVAGITSASRYQGRQITTGIERNKGRPHHQYHQSEARHGTKWVYEVDTPQGKKIRAIVEHVSDNDPPGMGGHLHSVEPKTDQITGQARDSFRTDYQHVPGSPEHIYYRGEKTVRTTD